MTGVVEENWGLMFESVERDVVERRAHPAAAESQSSVEAKDEVKLKAFAINGHNAHKSDGDNCRLYVNDEWRTRSTSTATSTCQHASAGGRQRLEELA